MIDTTGRKDYFEGCIGQDHLKRILGFYLDAYHAEGEDGEMYRILPALLFTAQKGSGKTHFCKQIASQLLGSDGEPKPMVEINCATVKSVKQLCEELFTEIYDQEVTLFFDECHELPSKVAAALLTILNPNARDSNDFSYGDYTFTFDFRKVTFLFATTERQLLFPPLIDRLEELNLAPYTPMQVAQIIKLNCAKVEFTNAGLDYIASFCRGNARSAAKMGRKIKTYMSLPGNDKFDVSDAKELSDILDLFPMGLTRAEVNLLQIIVQNGESALTYLTSQTGLGRGAQRDSEIYLRQHGLIDINEQSKRVPTKKGRDYIASLKTTESVTS